MSVSRRKFIKLTGIGASGLIFPLSNIQLAAAQTSNPRTLIVINQRGGADGLYMVSPTSSAFSSSTEENFYLDKREKFFAKDSDNTIKYKDSTGIVLTPGLSLPGSNFVLHPNMETFEDLYNTDHLTILHGVGGVNNHSHFKAMDAMERANPWGSSGGTNTGWLHDVVNQLNSNDSSEPAFMGVSLSGMAEAFKGAGAASNISAISSISKFKLNNDGTGSNSDEAYQAYKIMLDELYHDSADTYRDISAAGERALDAQENLSSSTYNYNHNPANWTDSDNDFSKANTFYQDLRDAIQLIKTGTGVRCININTRNSWDTHSSQITTLEGRIAELNQGVQSFMAELKENNYDPKDVCVVVLTEFGRTFDIKNGETDGTDHGEGGVMYVINENPNFNGGRVHHEPWTWPTTMDSDDNTWGHGTRLRLPDLTDFRAVFKDLMMNFLEMDITDAAAVFGMEVPDEGQDFDYGENPRLGPRTGRPNLIFDETV
jgi:uncharacterized protein (DUF1501 family)